MDEDYLNEVCRTSYRLVYYLETKRKFFIDVLGAAFVFCVG